jgi:hypothetical protein
VVKATRSSPRSWERARVARSPDDVGVAEWQATIARAYSLAADVASLRTI